MGKKRVSVLGSENEESAKAKSAVKREQKKLREGVKPKTDVVVETTPIEPEIKKSPKKEHHRSKQYQSIKKAIDVNKNYSLSEGIKLLKQISKSKFDPSVELHLVLKEKGVNKEVELPHATGKVKRIAIADDKTMEKIEKNIIDFDVLLASVEQMSKLVKFAKILGPKGLMPNPKNGTVVPDPAKTAKTMLGKNTITLKTEKDAPLIHTLIGKLSMTDKQLSENIQAILSVLSGKIAKVVLKSSMSPAIKLQL